MTRPNPLFPKPPRRSLLKSAAAVAVGAFVTLVPAIAGLATYFDPVRRMLKAKSPGFPGPAAADDIAAAEAGFIDVVPLQSLPADGMPRRFQVIAERVDAWTKHPAAPIGAVMLKRSKDDPDEVIAFNVICPHAGCSVEIAPPGPGGKGGEPGGFRCPCHNSAFHPDGSIVPGHCVSPRGLDQLEVDDDGIADGIVRVRFQNFTAGTREKIPTT